METDLTSVIIGLGLLLLFMAPIFFYQLSVSNKERKLSSLLKKTANANQANIDEKEVFRTGFALGIDKQKRLLIWVQQDPDSKETRHEVYTLTEYDKCSVYKSQSGTSKGDGLAVNDIGINLKTNNKNKSVNIPICSVRQGWLAGDESVKAERWVKLVQPRLASSR